MLTLGKNKRHSRRAAGQSNSCRSPKSALDGEAALCCLAVIYAVTGERDLAFKQLEVLAKIPCGVTYGDLRLNLFWDPLRGDPRFEKIVASLAPKEVTFK